MTSTHPSPTFPRSLSVSTERRNSRRPSGRSNPSPVDPQAVPDNQEAPAITEEISEIKRYEDFTTIDWVQDAVYEQSRRRAKRRSGTGFWDQEGIFKWRRKVYESYDAGQAWLVVTLVGMAIGLNSAVLNIITEWLSDIKLGHCTTAFYLNENFCCWGAENGKFTFTIVVDPRTNRGTR
jgi:chloride channel 3/4/5